MARQEVLKAERTPANFDPIIGMSTPFTRSLLTPATAWSPESTVEDSLYFPKEEVTKIQSAVAQAFEARERADFSMLGSLPTTNKSTESQGSGDSSTSDFLASETKLLNDKLEAMRLRNEQNSEASSRIISLQNSNARTLRAYNTAHAIKEFGRKEGDTGSAEVQAAILTARILAEATHIANNKKDVHGFRGFRGLVHQRQKVLKYLRTESVERYFACINRLGLSDQAVVKEITM